jgi:hypothetical protein
MPDLKPWEEDWSGQQTAAPTPVPKPWEENWSQQSAPAQTPSKGLLGTAIDYVSEIPKAITTAADYIDSPVRAGLGALKGGQGLLGAASAAKNQFGQPAENAPSWMQLTQGLSDKPILSPDAVRNVEGGLLRMAHIPIKPEQVPSLPTNILSASPHEAAANTASIALSPSTYALDAVAPAVKGIGKLGEAASPMIENAAETYGNWRASTKKNINVIEAISSLKDAKATAQAAGDLAGAKDVGALLDQVRDINVGSGGKVNRTGLDKIHDLLTGYGNNYSTQAGMDAAHSASQITSRLVDESNKTMPKAAAEAAESLQRFLNPAGLIQHGMGAAGLLAGSSAARTVGLPTWMGAAAGGAAGEKAGPYVAKGLLSAGKGILNDLADPRTADLAKANIFLQRKQNQRDSNNP